MFSTLWRLLFRLLRLAFAVAAVGALVAAALGYAVYRLLGGKPAVSKRLQVVRSRVQLAQKDAWLKLKIPGLSKYVCPHCNAPLDPQRHDVLCPECYGDLQRTCPGCGEAVPIQRRICPHCQTNLQQTRP